MNSKEQPAVKASAAAKGAESSRQPVSIFLAADKARGLHAAGRYATGIRHDAVPVEIADLLVARYGFAIVPADFIPSKNEG